MASTSLNPHVTRWTSLSDDELTVDNVQKILNSLQDDLWVSSACVDRLVGDTAVQRTLLEIGIERTLGTIERSKDAFTFPSSSEDVYENNGDELSDSDANVTGVHRQHDSLVEHFKGVPADAQLCYMRAMLLDRLDRLNTFVDIHKAVSENQEDELQDEIEEWEDDPWVDGTAASSTPSSKATAAVQLPVSLPSFLSDGLLRTSCLLASQQCFWAIRALFERHGLYLWPYRFMILESIPEHAHPSLYRDILPALDPSSNSEEMMLISNGWRSEQDWSETTEVRAAVEASGIHFSLKPSLGGGDSHPDPLTASELMMWYQNRVNRILVSTGMVDMALTMIQHGVSHGIPNLDELGEELSLLSRLVYDAPRGASAGSDDDWTLSRWNSMDPPSVVRAYLSHSTPDTLPKDISRLVLPYLFVLESRAERASIPDPSLPDRLLYDYILTIPLEMAAAVFEASKPTLPAAQRIIRREEDIARLALACLYGSNSLDEWSTMSRIFECLPAWDIAREDDNDEDAADTTITSLGSFVTPSTTRPHCTASDLLVFFKPLPLISLSRALDILDIHLEAGEILSRWGVPAPLRWFLQSSDDHVEQRAWANRMARRAGSLEDRLDSPEDWSWLLEDMLKLSGKGDSGLRGAFGLLSKDEVIRIFFGGLLSTGKFIIANSLLHSPKSRLSLDSKAIEDICLLCSHEFYDNASSGNYKFGDMKLAYECLDVPPPSDRLNKEKEFIEATSRLSSFNIASRPGIPISPIEIRLTKDRLSLISRVLSSNVDAYKHTEVILDLMYKLGYRDDAAAEVKTLAMLADTALQVEDFSRAYETSERMVSTVLRLRSSTPIGLDDPKVQEASEVCWVACFQLGRQPEFDDIDKKLLLLGRALELCPPEKLHDVLTAWRLLEKKVIQNRQEKLYYGRTGSFPAPQKRSVVTPSNTASSLRARLQDFHMPSPPLLNTPDAAALASRTFRSVAANFPFSVGGRGRSQTSQQDDERPRSESRSRYENDAVSTQATRVFQKGIGWLIGAEENI